MSEAELQAEVDRLGEWINDYKREQEAIISRYMNANERLRAALHQARQRIVNAVDPVAVGITTKAKMLADIDAALTMAAFEQSFADDPFFPDDPFSNLPQPIWDRVEHGSSEMHPYGLHEQMPSMACRHCRWLVNSLIGSDALPSKPIGEYDYDTAIQARTAKKRWWQR